MFRLLAKLLGLFFGASLVAGMASALAALAFKQKAPPPPAPGDETIDLAVVMAGGEYASTAATFRGGRVVCWYAGSDVDLRDATFDAAGATLDVRTVFGGTRVVVAPGVPVNVSVISIFGGTMDSTDAPEPTPDVPGLRITGFTIFGGLQVMAAERGEGIPAWSGEREHAADGATLEVAPDEEPTLVIGADIAPA